MDPLLRAIMRGYQGKESGGFCTKSKRHAEVVNLFENGPRSIMEASKICTFMVV